MEKLNYAIIGLKYLKLIFNIIILCMYRYGDSGYPLGASFRKNHDLEAFASGLYIGYLVYSIASLIFYYKDKNSIGQAFTDITMSLAGSCLWIVSSIYVLYFWTKFNPSDQFINLDTNPKNVGIAMGSLTLINGIIFGVDAVLCIFQSYRNYTSYSAVSQTVK